MRTIFPSWVFTYLEIVLHPYTITSYHKYILRNAPMKTLKLLSLFILTLFLSHCGTTEPPISTNEKRSFGEVTRTLDRADSMFYIFAEATSGNIQSSIAQTMDWLKTQPNVTSAETLDSLWIRIKLTSGLETRYYITQVDDDSISIWRGGGGSKSPQHTTSTYHDVFSMREIENKKVLIYAPAAREFYNKGELEKIRDYFIYAPLGLSVTLLKDRDATPDVIETFGDYGLVIMDTHGMPDGFMTGGFVPPKSFDDDPNLDTAIAEEKYAIVNYHGGLNVYNRLLSGDLVLEGGRKLLIKQPTWWKTQREFSHEIGTIHAKSSYIRSLPNMSTTVIFGNMCYSGWNFIGDYTSAGRTYKVTDPIRAAFLSKQPISYYGYTFEDGTSRIIDNGFAKQMEDSLVRAFVIDEDSTGNSHLRNNGNEFVHPAGDMNKPLFLKHFGADDYSYDDCIDTFIDARDNQIYKAVCLGTQVWMAENLKYEGAVGYCYDSLTSNCKKYGKLYPWSVAMGGSAASNAVPSGVEGICPKGWHIPSEAEWDVLFTYLGGRSVAGSLLRAQPPLWNGKNGGADSVGFNALPGGHAYWTGTKDDMRLTFPGGPSHPNWSRNALFLTSSIEGTNPKAISLSSSTGVVNTVTYGNSLDPYQPALNTVCRCVKN